LIAESGAALAGFEVPQNFNRPWLAVDIRDFWNRWHISMAKFVTQYIFLPLNLRGFSPRFATAASFVFMGLWHEVRIGYIIWGVAHGLLMAYAPKSANIASPALKRLNRLATLVSVVVLSYVANYAFK
jgi:D-alanyl-lipoteichoic acid acyltransferase DltB (MBOAT superfamily)